MIFAHLLRGMKPHSYNEMFLLSKLNSCIADMNVFPMPKLPGQQRSHLGGTVRPTQGLANLTQRYGISATQYQQKRHQYNSYGQGNHYGNNSVGGGSGYGASSSYYSNNNSSYARPGGYGGTTSSYGFGGNQSYGNSSNMGQRNINSVPARNQDPRITPEQRQKLLERISRLTPEQFQMLPAEVQDQARLYLGAKVNR